MIPFVDLKTQFKHLEKEIRTRMDAVLKHGNFIMGPEVKELEEKLAAFIGVKYCVGCASGTDALLMALMAMDVGRGDAVLTTPFTFVATAEVISLLGAMPIFVDIDPQTFNIDPDKLALAIRALQMNDSSIYPLPSVFSHQSPVFTPKGVIPVDLFGLPCDYTRINAIAQTEGLFVIEDAAQGLGGEYKGKKACSLADIGCTSFFPAKPLGCYGDGGAVFTDSDRMAEQLASIRIHGQGAHKYENVRIGLNARLDTLQAAILIPKLEVFPKELEARQSVAEKYSELLSAFAGDLSTPDIPSGPRSAWAQYSILTENSECRAKLQASLKDAGIPTAVYYPKPLHLQTAFQYLEYKEGDFPVSEDFSRRIFSLPMHPYLKDEQIEKIVGAMKKVL